MAVERENEDEVKPEPRTMKVADLLQGAREIRLEHNGAFYALRITHRNKLILNRWEERAT